MAKQDPSLRNAADRMARGHSLNTRRRVPGFLPRSGRADEVALNDYIGEVSLTVQEPDRVVKEAPTHLLMMLKHLCVVKRRSVVRARNPQSQLVVKPKIPSLLDDALDGKV